MDPRQRAALAVLCMASFLAVVDTTIVAIALPSMRRALDLSPGGAQWVINAYVLVFGGLLLLCGRLADRIGRRRSFVAGLALFAAGSLVAGLAPQAWLLIAGRVLQALGAAAFVPTSLALLTGVFPATGSRSRALGVYGAMGGVGFVTGMVGGGVIAEWWGWRWIFLINLPLVAITLLPVRRVLAESRGDARAGPVDAGGAAAVTMGVVLLIFAITSGPQAGWRSPTTVIAGACGCAALVVFVLWERRHPAPLVPLAVLGRAPVVAPDVAVALQSMVGVAWLFLLTLYFQEVRGLDASVSGLLFAPMTVASVVGAVLAGRMVAVWGRRPVASAGIVLVVLGLVLMAQAAVSDGGLAVMIAGMVVGETGFMLGSVALTIAATSALGDADAGLAAGLLNTATQLGGGVGLGVVTAVVAAAASPSGVTADALRLGFLSCIVFSLLALVVVLGGVRSTAPALRDAAWVGSREGAP
jgi:EmrB/QacA subfamily drug resistance transporter